MDWIKRLKISDKLLVLMVTSLVFVVIVGCVGFYFTNSANKSIKQLYSVNLQTISNLGTIRGNYEQGIADVLYLFDDISLSQKKHWEADLKDLRSKNGELLKTYQDGNISDYEKERIKKVLEKSKTYWAQMYIAISYADKGNSKLASAMFNSNLHYIIEERILLEELIKYNENEAANIHEQNTKAAVLSNTILITTLLASFVLLITLGLMISKMITDPITEAVDNLEDGATQVAAASVQLSAASEKLAEGSSEQAAAIQETSASIEESDSMVKQNSENTQEADLLARNVKNSVDNSIVESEKMVKAMEKLEKSNEEIAKIIKLIDEIAFQTNILALNAAVEAARAGDAGRGFAVVAEEVRNLAQKSAQATKDTEVIIDVSINSSKEAIEASLLINTHIKDIDLEAAKLTNLLDEISVASKEQAQGIEQIDKAIQQMEQVLQANASTAEESASASRELSSQASSVKEIVNALLVMVEGENALKTTVYK